MLSIFAFIITGYFFGRELGAGMYNYLQSSDRWFPLRAVGLLYFLVVLLVGNATIIRKFLE